MSDTQDRGEFDTEALRNRFTQAAASFVPTRTSSAGLAEITYRAHNLRRRRFRLVAGSGLGAAAAVIAIILVINLAGSSRKATPVIPVNSPPAPTVVVTFQPFVAGTNQSSVKIASTTNLTAGEVGSDAQSFGCFISPDRKFCLTRNGPWDTTAVEEVFPPGVQPGGELLGSFPKSEPFALQLSDGRRCINVLHGAAGWNMADNLVGSYDCSKTGSLSDGGCGLKVTAAPDCLYGAPDTTGPLWTIKFGSAPTPCILGSEPGAYCSDQGKIVGTATITKAWLY